MLGMRKTVENGAMTVAIKGEIDTISSVKLDREIGVVEGLKSVTLDMKEVSYITSAGIRVLLGVGKRMSPGADLALVNLQPTVREIFRLCGLEDLIGQG